MGSTPPDQPQRRAGQRRRAAEQVPLGVVAQRAGRAARGQPGQLMRRCVRPGLAHAGVAVRGPVTDGRERPALVAGPVGPVPGRGRISC